MENINIFHKFTYNTNYGDGNMRKSKIDFELVECIINTKADLNVANKTTIIDINNKIENSNFIKANKAKLDYLIKEVKQKGFSLDTINELKLRIS